LIVAGKLQLKISGTGREQLPTIERKSIRPALFERLSDVNAISFSSDGNRLIILDNSVFSPNEENLT
jgi:hypothetical protein